MAGTRVSTTTAAGVLAVLLGGLLSTLHGRVLSVALADLRGALHLTVEQAAWVSTSFNMALMFMAVFTVYFGALLGVRRVLQAAALIYLTATLLTPFAAGYGRLLALQTVAGLSAGTFYPLTLSYILLNLPIRAAHWGLAAYSLSILFGVNIAAELVGRVVEQFSWGPLFWLMAAAAGAMVVCVRAGIPPPAPAPARGQARVSWRGLLYWSVALALFYGALDMGERVRWWDSPAFAAMMAAGAVLLAASFARRKQDPNPLLRMPVLRAPGTLLLSAILFAFRFFLLSTALLIPQFLAGVGGLRNEQVGPALALTAVLQFGLAWVVARSLVVVDTRVVMAAGFTVIGLTAWWCAGVDAAWAPSTFVGPLVVFAAGESMAMLGLVGSIVMELASTGTVSAAGQPQRPMELLTFSSYFHTVRIFGGQVGTVLMAHVITERTEFHVAMLGRQVEGLAGYGLVAAVHRQAATLAFADGFTVLARGVVAVLVCIALVRLRFTRFKELG